MVHRREADGPNAIWQADHTPLDIWLIGPDGQAAKPWLTVVIDDYSRAVAGYFLAFEAPCVLHTALALRQGDLAQRGFALDSLRHPGGPVHRSRE